MHEPAELLVRRFIADSFLYRERLSSFSNDASFLEANLIDSTGVLELVMFLEKTFSIHVEDSEIVPENLDSIRKITAYIKRKTAPAAEPVGTDSAVL